MAQRQRQRQQRDAHPRSEGGTGRLQALADGVFAVAMTVLALGLPDGAGSDHNANLTIITALDAIGWWYAVGRGGLADRLPAGFARVSTRLAAFPAAGFALTTGIAWLSPQAALVLDVALP